MTAGDVNVAVLPATSVTLTVVVTAAPSVLSTSGEVGLHDGLTVATPDIASAGASRSRDKARANNSLADLVTVMVCSLADPNNSPGAGPSGRSIIPPLGQHEKVQSQQSFGITPFTAAI